MNNQIDTNKVFKNILYLFLFLVVNSCTSSYVSDKIVEYTFESKDMFFDELDLGASGSNTRLFITAEFDECGEWGGHRESMEVYAKSDKSFYLKYKKYKVNCDSIGKYYGTPEFQKLLLEKNIKLDESNKKSITDFMTRMVKSKIGERHPGHSGVSFSIVKSDSTLVITVYDSKGYDLMSYDKLINELNLNVEDDCIKDIKK